MTSQGIQTVLSLICSNIFMTLAWYGHLKMQEQFSFDAVKSDTGGYYLDGFHVLLDVGIQDGV